VRKADPRAQLLATLRSSTPRFARIVGVPTHVEIEPERDLRKQDHVWLTLRIPPFGEARAVINTLSSLNRDAGFDARIRIGTLHSRYDNPPEPLVEDCSGFDYATLEATQNIFYEPYEHLAAAEFLIRKGRAASRAEAWGELYGRNHLGLHQIHSRRASSAVRVDVRNRDGALKFYFPDSTAEMLFFKFVGQP
jgi:hypothetical protein